MHKSIYAFDLDGTITDTEILPLIAKELDIYDEIQIITDLTLKGIIDFDSSFKLRFQLLKNVPIDRVQEIISSTPINPFIEEFIKTHSEQCMVVTGNLDCWISPLVERLGCSFYSSTSTLINGDFKLNKILNKGKALRDFIKNNPKKRMIAIGDSTNDIPMFEEADIGIAYGGVHEPVSQLMKISDYITYDGEALCQLLTAL